jgi:hypothetical protein
MTTDEYRIALAELMGWKPLFEGDKPGPDDTHAWLPLGQSADWRTELPGLTLDWLHIAENMLTNDQRRLYIKKLIEVHPLHYDPFDPNDDRHMRVYFLVNATAEQRAEAILRVLKPEALVLCGEKGGK